MIDTLFTGPRTANGFIRRKRKHEVDFYAFGNEFTLNAHGVVCFRSTQGGRTHYRFPSSTEWPLGQRETEALADSLTLERDEIGRIYAPTRPTTKTL